MTDTANRHHRLRQRNLHLFVLVDVSGSMAPDGKMPSFNTAIEEALPHLRRVAMDAPAISVLARVLTFGSSATWIDEPVPIESFIWDELDAEPGGLTELGLAVDQLTDTLDRLPLASVVPPAILLVSDGLPTDTTLPTFADAVKLNEEQWYLATEYGPGEGHTTATVFDLPKVEGITVELRMEPGPDENISSPLVQTVDVDLWSASESVRCGGCYIASSEAHQMYLVVAVWTDDPDIISEHGDESFYTERLYTERLLEETAWGGETSGCIEGNVCWYESQIEAAEQRVTELQEQLNGSEDSQPLRDEISGLESDLAALQSQRDVVEAGLEETTNWLLPILMMFVAVAAAGAWAGVARRREPVSSGSNTAAVETGAVIGTLNLDATAGQPPPSDAAPRGGDGNTTGEELVTEPGRGATEDEAGPAAGRETPEHHIADREVPEGEHSHPQEP